MTTRKASIPPLTEAEEARIQAQIANDPDSPEITDEEAAQLRPFAEALPELHAAWKRRPGRPRAEVTKVAVKLRLDPDVVEGYRATGPGWQTRMNDVLRQGMSGSQALPASSREVSRDTVRRASGGSDVDAPTRTRPKKKAERA